PFTFYVGYELEIALLGSELPDYIFLFRPNSASNQPEYQSKNIHTPIVAGGFSNFDPYHFYVPEQGDYWVLGLYDNYPDPAHIVKWDILESVPIFAEHEQANLDSARPTHILDPWIEDSSGVMMPLVDGKMKIFEENTGRGLTFAYMFGQVSRKIISSTLSPHFIFALSQHGYDTQLAGYKILNQVYLASGITKNYDLFNPNNLQDLSLVPEFRDPYVANAHEYHDYVWTHHLPSYNPYGEGVDYTSFSTLVETPKSKSLVVDGYVLSEPHVSFDSKLHRDWPAANPAYLNSTKTNGFKFDVSNTHSLIGFFDSNQPVFSALPNYKQSFTKLPTSQAYMKSSAFAFHDANGLPVGIGLPVIKPELAFAPASSYLPHTIRTNVFDVIPSGIRMGGEVAIGKYSRCFLPASYSGTGLYPFSNPDVEASFNGTPLSVSLPSLYIGLPPSSNGQLYIHMEGQYCVEGTNRKHITEFVVQIPDTDSFYDTPPYLHQLLIQSTGNGAYYQNGISTTDPVKIQFKALTSHPERLGQLAYNASTHEAFDIDHIWLKIQRGASSQMRRFDVVNVGPDIYEANIDPKLLFDPGTAIPAAVRMVLLLEDANGNTAKHLFNVPILQNFILAP
ncbi:MAG: hypothetical protein KDK51_09875, partial [Deltaproteobacteria bacterium]|nr:hypothetical protein [Deltaproteobacteria bacterium]